MFQTNYHTKNSLSKWLLGVGLVCVLLKLWMVGGHEMVAKFRPHDDSLFAVLAINLLEGNWLGEYNNKTLIKGVGYPIFMAIAAWLGISILALQHLLYSFVCGLTVLALKPIVRNTVLLLFGFLFLLFNPLTYNYPLMSATLRASLYLSLSLWVFASLIGLWNRRFENSWSNIIWSLSLAISFSWFWITREESIWVIPGIFAYALIYLLPFKWNQGSRFFLRLCMLLIPGVFFLIANFTITHLNERYYGVDIINELKSDEFISALGGLMRIKHDKLEDQTLVSQDAEAKAFAVSPTFAELKPYLSGKKKLVEPFYIWELRSAARKVGYYNNPNDASREFEFYRKMGEEINAACDNGTLDCYNRRPSIRPVWHSRYNAMILPVFWELTASALSFSLFNAKSQEFHSKEDLETLFNFSILTGENTFRKSLHFEDKLPDYYRRMVALKVTVMGKVGIIYQYLTPVVFVLALLLHLYLTAKMVMQRQFSSKPVFGLLLLGSIITLLAILSFIKITIWPVLRPMHALSPIVLLYIVYMLLPFERND